jgi:hypothetical protein
MARPPIGERAMTAAERARRYRERHPERRPPRRLSAAEIAALKEENAALRRRLAELGASETP